MFTCKLRTTLETLQLVLNFEATLLNLNFEVDVLFERGTDMVWGELGKTFFRGNVHRA